MAQEERQGFRMKQEDDHVGDTCVTVVPNADHVQVSVDSNIMNVGSYRDDWFHEDRSTAEFWLNRESVERLHGELEQLLREMYAAEIEVAGEGGFHFEDD